MNNTEYCILYTDKGLQRFEFFTYHIYSDPQKQKTGEIKFSIIE